MNDFLDFLAERKYGYYHSLHIAKPQAYSKMDCQKRLETIIKYEELLVIIDWLSLEQQRIVDRRFDELQSL